jgi:hypothetical protein
MDTRKVVLFSRINGPVHVPLDGDGYYEALRGSGTSWTVAFDSLRGASTPMASIESDCEPALNALSPGLVLATVCTASGTRRLTALLRDRDLQHTHLWDASVPPTRVWPQLASSVNGLRLARETLEVTHPVGPYSPLDNDDIRGQTVQVYDLGTGAVRLTAPASPVLDGGGNFALSPSGNRFAVLSDGAIQVFDLPPAPPIPAAASPAPVVAHP